MDRARSLMPKAGEGLPNTSAGVFTCLVVLLLTSWYAGLPIKVANTTQFAVRRVA